MAPTFYRKQRHIVDASHIRQYPRAVVGDQHDALKVRVDQLTPKDNPNPSPEDVTLIAAHANGIGKELYEPLWDDLYESSRRSGSFKIRNIWIMDVSWQGESAALNEEKMGDDPSWFDTPRDLFVMIHHFRDQMKMPMVGVGHSMGGSNIVTLATIHPRLFASVILIDPVFQRNMGMLASYAVAVPSTFRRDLWPSREEAAKAFLKNKFYQRWDKRIFDKWIEHGLRELPTSLYPDEPPSSPNGKPVTLATSKHQEVFTFLRSNHPRAHQPLSGHHSDRRTHPDLPVMHPVRPFYRPEMTMTFSFLPYLRPRCFYIFVDNSAISSPPDVEDKLKVTGYGVGGNGGMAGGGVRKVIIPNAGHFVPFEEPRRVADLMAEYLQEELLRWRSEAALDKSEAEALQGREKFTLSEDRIWWTRVGSDQERALERQEQQSAAVGSKAAEPHAAKRGPKL